MASVEEPGFRGSATGEAPVRRLLEYSTVRLREIEKTRRLLLGSTVALVLLAAAIAVFAPKGREQIGHAISAVLVILALGAAGAAKFRVKLPGVELDAEHARQRDVGAPRRRGSQSVPE